MNWNRLRQRVTHRIFFLVFNAFVAFPFFCSGCIFCPRCCHYTRLCGIYWRNCCRVACVAIKHINTAGNNNDNDKKQYNSASFSGCEFGKSHILHERRYEYSGNQNRGNISYNKQCCLVGFGCNNSVIGQLVLE